MTTKEAFEKLISKRGWYNDLGINANAGNLMVNRFRQGNLSAEKIDEVLGLAGYQVVNEKQWAEPGSLVQQVDFKSNINGLIDMPEDYFDTFKPWFETHQHMIPSGTEFIEQMRMYDEYRKRKAAQEERLGRK